MAYWRRSSHGGREGGSRDRQTGRQLGRLRRGATTTTNNGTDRMIHRGHVIRRSRCPIAAAVRRADRAGVNRVWFVGIHFGSGPLLCRSSDKTYNAMNGAFLPEHSWQMWNTVRQCTHSEHFLTEIVQKCGSHATTQLCIVAEEATSSALNTSQVCWVETTTVVQIIHIHDCTWMYSRALKTATNGTCCRFTTAAHFTHSPQSTWMSRPYVSRNETYGHWAMVAR